MTSILFASCQQNASAPSRLQPGPAASTTEQPAANDFVRLPWSYSKHAEKVIHRFEIDCDEKAQATRECLPSENPGELLARIWTRFGPPAEGAPWERFSYVFVHVPSRTVIVVDTWKSDVRYEGGATYAGPLPPPPKPTIGFSKVDVQPQRFIEIVKQFERSLVRTPLAECRLVDDTDEDDLHAFGAHGGRAFSAPLTFEESIDFYMKLIETHGPETDTPIYHLGRPRLRLLFVWLDASAERRKLRPAALEQAKSAWLYELEELERGNRADSWQEAIRFLTGASSVLMMDPNSVARLEKVAAALNAEHAKKEQLVASTRARCGSQKTGFAGRYEVVGARTGDALHGKPVDIASLRPSYTTLEVKADRILVAGAAWQQEFCLTRVLERTPTGFLAEVFVESPIEDFRENPIARIRLQRDSADKLTLTFLGNPGSVLPEDFSLNFRKKTN